MEPIRIHSWNVNKLHLWEDMGASDAAVFLLQECPRPPSECAIEVDHQGEEWLTEGWERRPWRAAIGHRANGHVKVQPLVLVSMSDSDAERMHVSRPGTIAAGKIAVGEREVVTAVSVYSPWERPLGRDEPCWADGSAHRILSDLAPLLWDQQRHPVIVAGDFNILYGYGEHGDPEYERRYGGVFDRAEALGLVLVGPKFPNGAQAEPWPEELPPTSKCVPTYRPPGGHPTRQLDFVFASAGIASRVQARALNGDGEWGASDHCRIAIDLEV